MYHSSSSYVLHLDLYKNIKIKKEDKQVCYFSVYNYESLIIRMLIKTIKSDF